MTLLIAWKTPPADVQHSAGKSRNKDRRAETPPVTYQHARSIARGKLGVITACIMCLASLVWLVSSDSLICIGSKKSDLFLMGAGLHQGCPLSMISKDSQGVEGVEFCSLKFSFLLFADDVVLLATSASGLQLVLEWFTTECEAWRMRIRTYESKAVVLSQKRGKFCVVTH